MPKFACVYVSSIASYLNIGGIYRQGWFFKFSLVSVYYDISETPIDSCLDVHVIAVVGISKPKNIYSAIQVLFRVLFGKPILYV